jgi:hypothetical protein
MHITLNEFLEWKEELAVIIHSIDMVGYQASVIIGGKEHLLWGEDKRPFRQRSLGQMRESLKSMPVSSMILSHQSAYDEMINQPKRTEKNTLELPLSVEPYAHTAEPYPAD